MKRYQVITEKENFYIDAEDKYISNQELEFLNKEGDVLAIFVDGFWKAIIEVNENEGRAFFRCDKCKHMPPLPDMFLKGKECSPSTENL